jgi:hypothetical protein
MKIVFTLTALVALAACGAGGPPFKPTANIGLTAGPGGVGTTCSVGGTNGTVTIGVAC